MKFSWRILGATLCGWLILSVGAARADSESLVYQFKGGGDGTFPEALIAVDGGFYGVNFDGGPSTCYVTDQHLGCGRVFHLTTDGVKTSVYRFKDVADGQGPHGGLVYYRGALYGTTMFGGGGKCAAVGTHGCGTVFKLSLDGIKTTLAEFSGDDNRYPWQGLSVIGGEIYGSAEGYDKGLGSVFKITPTGTLTTLHKFDQLFNGAVPYGAPVELDGLLYGTTVTGGDSCNHPRHGCGVVYSLDAAGKEIPLHRFAARDDGSTPRSGLTAVGGALYGTTFIGGKGCPTVSKAGCGIVFKMLTDGTMTILHRFAGQPTDGAGPAGRLKPYKGGFLGTTEQGGTFDKGALFRIDHNGNESVLHSFGGPGDGTFPQGDLILMDGTIYGTTALGGRYNAGTVFKYVLP